MMKSVLVALWGAVAVQGDDAIAQAEAEMTAALAAVQPGYEIRRWDAETCGEDAVAISNHYIAEVCGEMALPGGTLQVKITETDQGVGHINLMIAATAADD